MAFTVGYYTGPLTQASIMCVYNATDAMQLIAELEATGFDLAYVRLSDGQEVDLATLQAKAEHESSSP